MRPSRTLFLAGAACCVATLGLPSVAGAATTPGGADRTFVSTAVDTKDLNVAEPSINVVPTALSTSPAPLVDGSKAVIAAFGGLTSLAFIRSVVSTDSVVNGPAIGVNGGDDYQWPGNVYVGWNERHPDVQETWTLLSSSTDGGKT